MLLIVVLMVVPIVMVISYSFRDNVIVQENSVFAGLANYTKVLTDPDFLVALKNTAVFISVSTVAHLVLGLAFAMMLNTQLLSGVTKADLPDRLHPALAVHDRGDRGHLAAAARPVRRGQLRAADAGPGPERAWTGSATRARRSGS